MKRYLILLMMLAASTALAQKRTVDTLEFVKGGNIFQFIVYNTDDAVDSIKVNGYMVRLAGVASYWQDEAGIYIKPFPDTRIIKYPHVPYWNHNMSLNTDGPIWFRKSDGTLRGKIMLPETVGGTETATITCQDGGTYLYETEGADFVIYIDDIDSIPAPFMIKNLGKNSTVTVQSSEGLPFDSTGRTSITLDYGDWCRFTPDSTRFITESNMNKATLEEYIKKAEADTVYLKKTEDSLYRYTVYSSGNNNVEVLATTKEVTASLANSNEFTFTIPDGTKVLSAKIRVENLNSIVVIIGNGDMSNDSMSTRWMPTVAGWREDTGQQLMGMTTLMDLSNFSKFTVNGLINSTRCQIRIGF